MNFFNLSFYESLSLAFEKHFFDPKNKMFSLTKKKYVEKLLSKQNNIN